MFFPVATGNELVGNGIPAILNSAQLVLKVSQQITLNLAIPRERPCDFLP